MKTKTALTYPCTLERNAANFESGTAGAHCKQCDKTITDFSNYTDEALAAYLKANAGKNQCGIFHPTQLHQNRSWWNGLKLEFKAAAVFALALLASRNVMAGDTKTIVPTNGTVSDNDQVRMLSADSLIYHVKGTVTTKTKKALPVVRVRAYKAGTDMEVGVVYTGKNGNFEIMIPAAEAGETFDLEFSRYRYHDKTIRNYTPGMEPLEIKMKNKRRGHGIFGRRRHYTMGKF